MKKILSRSNISLVYYAVEISHVVRAGQKSRTQSTVVNTTSLLCKYTISIIHSKKKTREYFFDMNKIEDLQFSQSL